MPRSLNLFFDVDCTLISLDGDLRPRTRETFQRLVADGHQIYIWSGVGIRDVEMREHALDEFVSGIYVKPLDNFDERLATFGVPLRPDFVVDDFREIVKNFGGFVVRPYFFPSEDDDEMDVIYRAVTEFVDTGRSEHPSFFPRN